MSIWLEPRTLLIGLIVLGMAFTEGSANDWLAIGMVDDRGVDNGQGAAGVRVFIGRDDGGRIGGGAAARQVRARRVLRGRRRRRDRARHRDLRPDRPDRDRRRRALGCRRSLGFPVGMSAAADDPVRPPRG